MPFSAFFAPYQLLQSKNIGLFGVIYSKNLVIKEQNMRLIKAGESHGEAMVGILSGVPAGIVVKKEYILSLLKERRTALGRSERQLRERDKVDIVTGIRKGITLGNNVAMVIKNAVWQEYKEILNPFECDESLANVTAVRPGHADLAGLYRTGFSDARNILEGASARNTCLDVALGAVSVCMLEQLGVKIAVRVKALGEIKDEKEYSFEQNLNNKAPAFTQNKAFVSACKKQIEKAKTQGQTLGGVVEITVSPLKLGFGSYVAEKRVNALIAGLLMQIQAVKGVYFGENPFDSGYTASQYVGSIENINGKVVTTSSTGGIDGGMTNGDHIKITVAVKAIPTTKKGSKTIDVKSGEVCISAKERSDVTAVFAICPVLKCVTATALSQAITERLGCDNMQMIEKRYNDLW